VRAFVPMKSARRDPSYTRLTNDGPTMYTAPGAPRMYRTRRRNPGDELPVIHRSTCITVAT